MSLAVRIRALSVTYGHHRALDHVDFDAAPGGITALVGPSGCGKSSLLLALNRLSDHIDGCRVAGSIHIGEQAVLAPNCDTVALRRQVGMLFQKPNPFPTSIANNCTMALAEHGVRPAKLRRERMEASLRAVGLWDEIRERLNQSALCLSGGQQQRLCLARALALEPQVLLMDEPCSALDPLASATIEDLICSLRGRYTIIVVTHNLAQARRIADHTAVFWSAGDVGRIVEQGPTAALFAAPKDPITQAYLAGERG